MLGLNQYWEASSKTSEKNPDGAGEIAVSTGFKIDVSAKKYTSMSYKYSDSFAKAPFASEEETKYSFSYDALAVSAPTTVEGFQGLRLFVFSGVRDHWLKMPCFVTAYKLEKQSDGKIALKMAGMTWSSGDDTANAVDSYFADLKANGASPGTYRNAGQSN